MITTMKAQQIPQHSDHDGYDPEEASCPPEVVDALRQRLASLDRGEGLTTDELRKQLRAAR